MGKTRILFIALLGIVASTWLAACNNSAPPQATPAAAAATSLPDGAVAEALSKLVSDSTAQPAAASQTVPFVGRPNAGAVLRAAGSNATPR